MLQKFPSKIPIFPLSGVIYFPKTNLPLNIFEQRYLDLVNDAIKSNRLMGMVQSIKNSKSVYKVGCLGKITDYSKTEDGRLLINLSGITRFEIISEIKSAKAYREFEVNYNKFFEDIKNERNLLNEKHNHDIFITKVKNFFKKYGLFLNWKEFSKLDKSQQINTISMIAPISNEEKQKLLETVNLVDKIATLSSIMEFYLYDQEKTTLQ